MRSAKLTARVHMAISPRLKKLLEEEAIKRRRTFPDTLRMLLEEALENTHEELIREPYEAELTPNQVTKLKKLGYQITPAPYVQLDLL